MWGRHAIWVVLIAVFAGLAATAMPAASSSPAASPAEQCKRDQRDAIIILKKRDIWLRQLAKLKAKRRAFGDAEEAYAKLITQKDAGAEAADFTVDGQTVPGGWPRVHREGGRLFPRAARGSPGAWIPGTPRHVQTASGSPRPGVSPSRMSAVSASGCWWQAATRSLFGDAAVRGDPELLAQRVTFSVQFRLVGP